MNRGLTSKQVSEKLKQFGYNELPSAQPKNLFSIAIEVMKEPTPRKSSEFPSKCISPFRQRN